MLTQRQLEVFALRWEGLMLKEIAYRLGIKPTTVVSHLERAKAKLDKEAK